MDAEVLSGVSEHLLIKRQAAKGTDVLSLLQVLVRVQLNSAAHHGGALTRVKCCSRGGENPFIRFECDREDSSNQLLSFSQCLPLSTHFLWALSQMDF